MGRLAANMLTRRQLVVGGGAGAAMLGLLPCAVQAAAPYAAPPSLSLFLADIACGGEIAGSPSLFGVPVASFSRDIGQPWMEHLEPLWRRSPAAVGGVTFGGAFFCLEELARNRGMVCTYRLCPERNSEGQLTPGSAAQIARTLLLASGRESPRRTRAPASGEAADRPLAWLLQSMTRTPAARSARPVSTG